MDKLCCKCRVVLPIERFGKEKRRKDGHSPACKECERKRGRAFYEKNGDRVRMEARERNRLNPEKAKARREKRKEVQKVYLKKWKEDRMAAGLPHRDTEKEKAKMRERYQNDPVYRERMLEKNRARRRQEPALAQQRKNEKERARTNPQYRIAKCLRGRVRSALRGSTKANPTMILLGCSMEHLKTHLESLFQPGMTWENHGLKGWHIDHVIPCAAFDLTREDEQRKCFHWSNLQPLWAFDNLSKNDWVADYQI